MVKESYYDYAAFAVEQGLAAGATQCEATVSVSDRFSAEARAETVTKLEQSTGRSLALRVFLGTRRAALSTSDFDRAALQTAVRRLVEAARAVGKDGHAGLPDVHAAAADANELGLFSDSIAKREPSEKIAESVELERLIRRDDARIQNSNGAHVTDAVTTTVLVNSNGFSGSYDSTRATRSVSPVAIDGSNKRTGSYGTAARSLGEMEAAEAVAAKAVQRTVQLFGARKPRTMRVPVIFERDVAAAVIGDIFTALSGASVAVGNSWAAERLGKKVGSDVVNVRDSGRLRGGLGSAPFDGEGIATQETVVFEGGVLRSFLLDTYYARRLGMQSTGNSTGGGIGPNNFFLQNGARSLESLISEVRCGVLVLDTIGFATEYATGTYSRGARGFLIENGELAYPIEEFTVAGTFPEMLAGMDAVANDLRFDGAVVSPSFRVAEMAVSGNS